MKKIGLIFKETAKNRIKEAINASHSFFIVQYSGLSGPELNILRQSLKNAKADILVVKNTVARSALADLGFDAIAKAVDQPCGFIFSKEEPVDASRVLYNFSREHEKLKFQAGLLKDRIINKAEMEAIAKLPAPQILRALVVMTLNAPIAGLVRVLQGTLNKFVWCLEEIKKKKTT